MDSDLREHAKRVEKELADIRRNTSPTLTKLALMGIARGGGFVVGSILAVALIGWLLNQIGLMPGMGDIAATLRAILEESGLP